ncbi:MAG: DUF1622 domain-containing protein [Candidatus Fimivivens sp.]
MILEHLIEMTLPTIIALLDIIGIFIITLGALKAFYYYLNHVTRRKRFNYKFMLLQDMATGLEFKMAAEILKTVLIRSLDELIILGAVIILRGLMSFMIHFEIKAEHEGELPDSSTKP